MGRLRSFWRAFIRALADEFGTKPTHESVITVDMDTTLAEQKLERLSGKVIEIQDRLTDIGRHVNRLDWQMSRDKFEA